MDGKYVNNTTKADAGNYYVNKFGRDNVEGNLFDVSYVKLREVSLAYNFPAKWLRGSRFFQSASLGLFGRDLLMISDFPSYDPEIATMNGNRIEPGFETGQFPSTRSYGVNLKVSF